MTNSDTENDPGEKEACKTINNPVVYETDLRPGWFVREESLRQAVLFWHGTNRNIKEEEIIRYAQAFEKYLLGNDSPVECPPLGSDAQTPSDVKTDRGARTVEQES